MPVEKTTEDKPDEAEDKEESKDDDGESALCAVAVSVNLYISHWDQAYPWWLMGLL